MKPPKDMRSIGRELNVQYALSGSVRRAGKDLRITAQLVDVESDAEVWGERFNGKLDDVFDIQERLSRQIVEALKARLTPAESRRLATRPSGNADAYVCYLKARSEVATETEAGAIQAIQTVERGIRLIGDNALLYGVMGHANLSRALTAIDREPLLAEAERCATHAEKLDATSPYPGFIRGYAALLRGHMQTCVRHLKAALAPYREMYSMSPHNPFIHWSYAFIVAWAGLLDESLRVLDAVIRDSPTTFWAKMAVFRRAALTRDGESAMRAETSDLVSAAKPNVYWSFMFGQNFALVGERERAIEWLEIAVGLGFINYPLLATHDPLLAGVRDDPAFARLMEQVRPQWEAFEA